MSSAKDQAGVTLRLLIRYLAQKPNYIAFDPEGPPIHNGSVQKEISKLGLPYCRNDAIEVPRVGQVQCEWYFETGSKAPQSMARKLCPEAKSARAKEIEDWMKEYYICRMTVTCKERGCPPKLIIKLSTDPSFSGDLNYYPGYQRLPLPARIWGSQPTENSLLDNSPKLGHHSLSDTTAPCNNSKRERSRSFTSSITSTPRSRSRATASVDRESMSSLAPPSTSATLVGDSFLNESCSKTDWMDVTNSPLQNKREREDDDSLMLNHPLSSASKRSRWDVRRSPKIGKSLERFRSRSISPDRKLNNIPSGPRYKENGFLRNSTLRDDFRDRYRSSSVSQDGVRKHRLERRENEDGGRSFRRSTPPPFTASLSSQRTYQPPASEPTATNNPAGQIGHDGTVGSATSTSSLLPISPVDLSKLLSAISTVAAAVPSSDSLSISNNESPSTALPSTTNPDANAESNTSTSPISMSDIDTLLKALPVAPSLPAPQQQVNESTSVAETGAGSTQAQTSAIASSSSRTPIVPMQTYYGQYGYPYSHPYPYQYPHSYPYPTMYTRPYAQSDPQTATAFLRSSASTTPSNLMDDSRIKEEPVDVSVNDSNHCPSQTEIELSSSRMPRIVQLRSELVRLKKEIQERAKRERTVLSELAELVEKLKTDFVLGELDREGLQGLELGSEIGMGFYEDDKLTERPNLSAIEIELQSNILILQAQLSNEQTGRRQAEQARNDAEYAKREAERTLEEVEQRLSETERLMKEAEQKQENAEFAKTEFENKTKEARLSLKDAIERRRDAEQLRRTAEHARNIADERRKEAEECWKDAEHDIRQANDRRREAEQASRDADKAKRRAESEKWNMDGQRQAAEQGRRDAEKGKWEMEQRWKDAELARERAEERVREAEGFVADVKRECRAPFVVPALMDAFLSVSKLTTQSGEVGRSLSETGDGSTEI